MALQIILFTIQSHSLTLGKLLQLNTTSIGEDSVREENCTPTQNIRDQSNTTNSANTVSFNYSGASPEGFLPNCVIEQLHPFCLADIVKTLSARDALTSTRQSFALKLSTEKQARVCFTSASMSRKVILKFDWVVRSPASFSASVSKGILI
ncbi:hypothetical protein SS50377_22752 [Spironucleus salmonicida]|uniref:Uncharacterized protein n=1 Tax=Spironucleus salmonicida TaxID=348837 RepID=V6LCS6_9EUKA|nr:hypothetical protein SS50377_22743 [Spironucleus salmonicida]KAH0575128.1 hypothetical protein SS50377_22752 [Spironucleus salmonicida]|eukprot:EST42285.1 Hypothetical protein SS50377_18153 [Spironucleus salmonicida]